MATLPLKRLINRFLIKQEKSHNGQSKIWALWRVRNKPEKYHWIDSNVQFKLKTLDLALTNVIVKHLKNHEV